MNNMSENTVDDVQVGLCEDYPVIRDGVRSSCADIPAEYCGDMDKRTAYPTEFVQEMTESGYLAVLIPEEYGGAGLPIRAAGVILPECHKNGCYATAAHA